MYLPESGFNKTIADLKKKKANEKREKPSRGPLTPEESERIREGFREAARHLVAAIDGKNRI